MDALDGDGSSDHLCIFDFAPVDAGSVSICRGVITHFKVVTMSYQCRVNPSVMKMNMTRYRGYDGK